MDGAAVSRSREALAAHFFANWTHACTDIQPPELDLAIGTLLSARSHIKGTAFLAGFACFVKNLRGITGRGDLSRLRLAAEGDVEKHHQFVVGEHDNVGDVEAGVRYH